MLKGEEMKGVEIEEKGDIVKMNCSFIWVEVNEESGEMGLVWKDGKVVVSDRKRGVEGGKDEGKKGK